MERKRTEREKERKRRQRAERLWRERQWLRERQLARPLDLVREEEEEDGEEEEEGEDQESEGCGIESVMGERLKDHTVSVIQDSVKKERNDKEKRGTKPISEFCSASSFHSSAICILAYEEKQREVENKKERNVGEDRRCPSSDEERVTDMEERERRERKEREREVREGEGQESEEKERKKEEKKERIETRKKLTWWTTFSHHYHEYSRVISMIKLPMLALFLTMTVTISLFPGISIEAGWKVERDFAHGDKVASYYEITGQRKRGEYEQCVRIRGMPWLVHR